MKNILGLDLGTNSIGWALVAQSDEVSKIIKAGTRVVPTDSTDLSNFDQGKTVSATGDRTTKRIGRRRLERAHLRRERLFKVFHVLGWLPAHFESQIDFEQGRAKFRDGAEPKLAWASAPDGKLNFLFRQAFEEMLADFARCQPELVADGRKVPYDWTVYYLRKKALTQPISPMELAWVLLHFNQKRGYNQQRGDELSQADDKKDEEYRRLEVKAVRLLDKKGKGGKKVYELDFGDGLTKEEESKEPIDDWVGMVKEYVVTTKRTAKGEIKRTFRKLNGDEWICLKKRTEKDLADSGKTVGEFIYDTLLKEPSVKVRGQLVRTIDRCHYRSEVEKILEVQQRFHPETFSDTELYSRCLQVLYPSNEVHRNALERRNLVKLLVDDVLFYQRPLRSQKSLIADCPFERYTYYTDKEHNDAAEAPLKCIPKSHPLFEELRLWQFIGNLRIYALRDNGKDEDVTAHYLATDVDYVELFDELRSKKSIKQDALLRIFKLKADTHRWNYPTDKEYDCCPTRAEILAKLKTLNIKLTDELELKLWKLLYSISSVEELGKALRTFAEKRGFDADAFATALMKMKPFAQGYGAYSAKAVKKLLSVMRRGRYWSVDAIDSETRARMARFVAGDTDGLVPEKMVERLPRFASDSDFAGLPLWLAGYVVYGRHSESADAVKWETPDDLSKYIKDFRQHSLRNPIVETVVMETLRVVRDVWTQFGQIDEIHVEMGREMKLTGEERKKRYDQMALNERTNLRIRKLLEEFLRPEFGVEGVRPQSPRHQDLMRIYEEQALSYLNEETNADDRALVEKMLKEPSSASVSEFLRYKLWLEQKCCSPYTGQMISLARLFTEDYEVEHVIPRARFFDDSLSNKVICEAAVNREKKNLLGHEFIQKQGGMIVQTGGGRSVRVFTLPEYEAHVVKNFIGKKRHKLLLDEIPEAFVERQLNDTRYITRFVTHLLSNVVREEVAQGRYEEEAVSKHLIVCTGGVTDRLKKDWGVNDVWSELMAPRYKRLNEKLENDKNAPYRPGSFGEEVENQGRRYFRCSVPMALQSGFNKKRIDHRHHAMDAIVIACATRNHVNYLNNESARKGAAVSRADLKRMLCLPDSQLCRKPWRTFTQDVRQALEEIVVSFKQNLRTLNKAANYSERFVDGKKQRVKQLTENYAIRKPLHKETYYGHVNLRRTRMVSLKTALKDVAAVVDKVLRQQLQDALNECGGSATKAEKWLIARDEGTFALPAQVEVAYFTDDNQDTRLVASRKPIDASFNIKKITENVTDTGIQKIMLNHLKRYGDDPKDAFSPEGIELMNRNIVELNGGKPHKPIYKVRVTDALGLKFAVGTSHCKSKQFVEAEKGTNLYYAVYLNEKGEREFRTIPLSEVIAQQKMGLHPVPPKNEKGSRLFFFLSPGDLVYVPTEDERECGRISLPLDLKRIYKMVSSTKKQCFFVQVMVAKTIAPEYEFGALNKEERALTGEMIAKTCVPITVDRLGNIVSVGRLEQIR